MRVEQDSSQENDRRKPCSGCSGREMVGRFDYLEAHLEDHLESLEC